jgi:hypothetical protein
MRPQPDASNLRNMAVVTRNAAVASQYSRSSRIESKVAANVEVLRNSACTLLECGSEGG